MGKIGTFDRYRVRHDGWTEARQRSFLRALGETGCVRDACARARISSTSAYRMRRREPRFAAAWKRALAKAAPTLEQAAFERAVIGWEEPILHKGEIVAWKRRFSDTLLRLLLIANRATQETDAAQDPEVLRQRAFEAAYAAGGEFTPPPRPGEPSARDRLLAKLDEMHHRLMAADAADRLKAEGPTGEA